MRKFVLVAVLFVLAVAAAGCIGGGGNGQTTSTGVQIHAVSQTVSSGGQTTAVESTGTAAKFTGITWPVTYAWRTAVFSVAGNVPFEVHYTYVNVGGGRIVSNGVYGTMTGTKTITGVTYFYVDSGRKVGENSYVIHAWLPTAPNIRSFNIVEVTVTLNGDTMVGSFTNGNGVTTYFTIAGLKTYGK